MSARRGRTEPTDEKYDEITHAGISLRAYHGFKEWHRKEAPVVCESISDLKDDILASLKYIDRMERKTKRGWEVVLWLTDPEEDMRRYDLRKPPNPAEGYTINIHFVDTWRQRKDIYESYEISIERELQPTAIYVHMRFLDKVYGR